MQTADAVLIDLAGVIYEGGRLLEGVADALRLLASSGLKRRFLTNTTRQTCDALHKQLTALGLEISINELQTAGIATRDYLQQHALSPKLLVHPALLEEFAEVGQQPPDCVVVGDAADRFSYENLNDAFRVLMEQTDRPLIAMGANRYFRSAEGLSLDMGPFVKALEFASDRTAILTGKPAPAFFQAALSAVGLDGQPDQAWMIGDDAEFDVAAAQSCGIRGVLVKTGKYRDGDEDRVSPHPMHVAADFVAAVELVIESAN